MLDRSRSEATRPKPQEPSPVARPEITFSWEKFSAAVEEALPLLRRHFAEVYDFAEQYPFDPDWPYYFALERGGYLHCLAIRADRKLIGYLTLILSPMLHTRRCLRARGDNFYLLPAWRGGSLFIRGVKECERKMRELGVNRIEWVPKRETGGGHIDSGILFRRLGYEEIEYTVAKLL